MPKTQQFIDGFKHGCQWTITRIKADEMYREISLLEDMKKAIKSLKEGR
jgi:hypothetical protein